MFAGPTPVERDGGPPWGGGISGCPSLVQLKSPSLSAKRLTLRMGTRKEQIPYSEEKMPTRLFPRLCCRQLCCHLLIGGWCSGHGRQGPTPLGIDP